MNYLQAPVKLSITLSVKLSNAWIHRQSFRNTDITTNAQWMALDFMTLVYMLN